MDKLILEIFSKYPYDKHLTASCLQIIRYFQGDLNKFFIMGAGVEILRKMNDFKTNEEIQAGGCYSIRTLGRCRANAIKFVSSTYKVQDILKQAMQTHQGIAEVQKAAASAIWCLCSAEEANKVLWEEGLPINLIESLQVHRKAAKVQEYGLQALKQFDYQYSLVRMGAATVTIDALKHHAQTPSVIVVALKVLRKFCCYNSNTETLALLDAPKLVVQVLQMSPRNTKLQFVGLGTIYQMSGVDRLRLMLVRAHVGRIFNNVIDTTKFVNGRQKATIPHTLLCIGRMTKTEYNVRQFLGIGLHNKLTEVAQKLLELRDDELASKVIEILINFCETLVEARQPISTRVKPVLDVILRTRQYGPLYNNATKLQGMI